MIAWRDNEQERPGKDGIYLVAVVSESGEKIVCSAQYERENGKDFWEILSYEYDVHNGRILFWHDMPGFPDMGAGND